MFFLAAALIVGGVALFVAAPLGIGLAGARAKSPGELQVERHEHERALAVQGLRELEFDREMGKLSDADYDSMHKVLEQRALTAMAAVENFRLQTGKAANPKRLSTAPRRPAAPSPSRKIRFCPQCGMHAAADSKFCAHCGVAIKAIGGATAWTE